MFTRPDGEPIHPGYVTQRFANLVKATDLPPIRLHDLRHRAASLAHEAGADLKTLQDLLGPSSIVVTADTYTSVLPLVQRRCAEDTARLVLAAAHRTRQKIRTKGKRNRPDPRRKTGAPTPTGLATVTKGQLSPLLPTSTLQTAMTPARHPRRTHRPHRTRQA